MKTLLRMVPVLLLLGNAGFADDRHPLTQALDYDAHLLLLADLRPTGEQLTDMLAASRVARTLQASYEKAHLAALEDHGDLLEAEHRALAEGMELTAEQIEALDELDAQEAERLGRMYAAVDAEMRRLRRNLSREQEALIDWTAPPEVPSEGEDTGRLEELRLLAARLTEASRFLERIRYLIVSDYSITRTQRTEEYLRQYVRPRTREYDEAMAWLLGMQDEARKIREDDWPAEAPIFASQMLQRLGLLEERPPEPGNGGAAYGWWDVFDLLTDPQTPPMLETITGAGPAAPEPDDQDDNNEEEEAE